MPWKDRDKLGIALPEYQIHMKLQNGIERRGNPSQGVVGSMGFNLAYLEYMLEFLLRGYDHFKLESWTLGKHC